MKKKILEKYRKYSLNFFVMNGNLLDFSYKTRKGNAEKNDKKCLSTFKVIHSLVNVSVCI